MAEYDSLRGEAANAIGGINSLLTSAPAPLRDLLSAFVIMIDNRPEAAGLPPWLKSALMKLAKAFAPSLTLRDFAGDDPRVLGEFTGYLHAFAASPENIGALADAPKGVVLDSIQAIRPFLSAAAADTILQMLAKPPSDSVSFFRGFSTALSRSAGKSGLTPGWTDATLIYLLIVMLWQKVAGFSSVGELHEWLISLLGQQIAGDLDRTKKICARIGLRYRGSGRPTKRRQ